MPTAKNPHEYKGTVAFSFLSENTEVNMAHFIEDGTGSGGSFTPGEQVPIEELLPYAHNIVQKEIEVNADEEIPLLIQAFYSGNEVPIEIEDFYNPKDILHQVDELYAITVQFSYSIYR